MEKLLTKYFWVFNLVTLAAVAFFLADGSSEIMASKLGEMLPESEGSARASTQPRRPTSKRWSAPSGDVILTRNIFDSTFDPLAVEEEVPEPEEVPDTVGEGGLPLVPCTDGKVKLLATVASRYDQDWSFASISEGKETRLCRVGDDINSRTVSGITWRYLFLRGTSDECYVDLFGDGKAVKKNPRKSNARAKKESGKKDDIKDGIQDISETEKVVDRSVVDKVLSDPTQFIRSVRVRPHKKNGKVVGFKLRRFRSDSPLALLGAKKGDIIHAVNGKALTSVDQALGAYQNLRSENSLTFSITRNGKPMDINVGIR